MHSSTTAVLLLLALFGTSIVDACDEHAAQAMAFTLLTNVSTWNGATDMFGLTKDDFHVTLTPFGTFKTELQLDCCCDPGQDIGSPASVCETKCNSVDLNVWKKDVLHTSTNPHEKGSVRKCSGVLSFAFRKSRPFPRTNSPTHTHHAVDCIRFSLNEWTDLPDVAPSSLIPYLKIDQ